MSSNANVWLLALSIPCAMFCFSFHEFQGEKYLVYRAILFIAKDLVVIDQFSNIS